MIGVAPAQAFADLCRSCGQIFQGYGETTHGQSEVVERIAVVGAMSDALVREAAERGADVYVTGQYRQPARRAVADTGISVIEIGHRRSEEWGLCALAGVLRERWAVLRVILPDEQQRRS
jgi:putative NIF3 family GTP cyclohydrolase 1 type 2